MVTVCSPYLKLLRNTFTGFPSRGRFGRGSVAQAEALDERLVALLVGLLEVIQQLAALVHHLDEPTAGMMVLLMVGEMGGEAVDTGRQQRHLYFGRAGVFGVAAIGGDDFLLLLSGESHY